MPNFRFAVPALLVMLSCFFTGCTTIDNNYLRPEDFAGYLTRAGIKVDGVRPLLPDPFRATSGCLQSRRRGRWPRNHHELCIKRPDGRNENRMERL